MNWGTRGGPSRGATVLQWRQPKLYVHYSTDAVHPQRQTVSGRIPEQILPHVLFPKGASVEGGISIQGRSPRRDLREGGVLGSQVLTLAIPSPWHLAGVYGMR